MISINFEFQFHNGSIKSWAANRGAFHNYRFQFHNGSIKSGLPNRYLEAKYVFQFHNGSIKSTPGRVPKCELLRFNSTMVRLKVVLTPKIIAKIKGFNSTMVRLKARNVTIS